MQTAINDSWDDEFKPPNPETTFLGYKCPYGYCNIITESHEICSNYISNREDKLENPDWFETFKWNWDQWLLKTHNNIIDRAL